MSLLRRLFLYRLLSHIIIRQWIQSECAGPSYIPWHASTSAGYHQPHQTIRTCHRCSGTLAIMPITKQKSNTFIATRWTLLQKLNTFELLHQIRHSPLRAKPTIFFAIQHRLFSPFSKFIFFDFSAFQHTTHYHLFLAFFSSICLSSRAILHPMHRRPYT